MHGKTLYWGICSAGRIAHDFTSALRSLPQDEHQVKAVAASSLERAQAFAQTHQIPRAYGTYEELAADPDLDVIYVSAITSLHYEHAKMMINAGKAVLCEKPLTVNVAQTRSLLSLAQKKKVFFMEGIWSRFFPAYKALQKAITDGEIGEVRAVQSAFGHNVTEENYLRRINTKFVGGGALLDVGIYQVQLCQYVFQEKPAYQHVEGYLSEAGLDISSSTTLKYSKNRIGCMLNSHICNLSNDATICGTKGFIRIHAPFWAPTAITVNGDRREFLLEKISGLEYKNSEGFRYQAQEVRKCLLEGLLECPVVTHRMSLEIAEILEKSRKDLGYTLAADDEQYS